MGDRLRDEVRAHSAVSGVRHMDHFALPQGLGLYVEDDDDGIVVGIAQGTGIFAFFDMIQHLVAVSRNAREHGRAIRTAWPAAIATPVVVGEATKDPIQAAKQAASLLTHVKSELDFSRFSMGGRKRSHRVSSRMPDQSSVCSRDDRHPSAKIAGNDGLSELCTVVHEHDVDSDDDSDAQSTLACEESICDRSHQSGNDVNPFDTLDSVHEAKTVKQNQSRSAKVRPMQQTIDEGFKTEASTGLATPYQTHDHPGSVNQPHLRNTSTDSSCTSPMTTGSDMTTNTRPPGYLRLVLLVCVRDEQSVPELDWLRQMEKECDEVRLTHIQRRQSVLQRWLRIS